MKSLIIILLLIIDSFSLSQAQILSPFVVASNGDVYPSSDGSLSFTTAEMTMVETFSGNNLFLNQGFHSARPEVMANIIESPSNKIIIKYYPNPTTGIFYVNYEAEDNSKIQVSIFNVIGLEIYSSVYYYKKGDKNIKFDISAFPEGLYIINTTIFYPDGSIIKDVAKICYEL